jgi:hypothetical protein
MDFTLCLFIYAYYKNKNKNFRILQVQLSANNPKQIEPHIYEGEYKLEPDNTGGFANVSFDNMSVISESALLSHFNLFFLLKSTQNTNFENLKFNESTQQYQHDINTNKFVLVDIVPEVNQKILEIVINTEPLDIHFLDKVANKHAAATTANNTMELDNKYLKYKLKYIILKNLKNSI